MNKMGHDSSQAPECSPQNTNVNLWEKKHRYGPSDVKYSAVEATSEAKSTQ
jgi:hypothetical protein